MKFSVSENAKNYGLYLYQRNKKNHQTPEPQKTQATNLIHPQLQ